MQNARMTGRAKGGGEVTRILITIQNCSHS